MQNRRTFIHQIAAGSAGLAFTASLSSCIQTMAMKLSRVYIGTYTRGNSRGIYQGLFDHATGSLIDIQLVAETTNPSYLTLHPGGGYVFSVNEVTDFNGTTAGAVSSFVVGEGGQLSLINQQITRGGAPCYISTDATGSWIFIANYGGGNVVVFPVNEHGAIGEASAFVQHEGSSVNENRQQAPHAHCILPGPTGTHVYAADLGIDKVQIYAFDPDTGTLTPNSIPYTATAPGAGPRHLVFHPDGKHAFVINELDSSITSFAIDPSTGALTPLDTASTLPEDFTGQTTCADIHVHPNGRFVYGSNRGHDSIAIMAFDHETGSLSLLGNESTGGQKPRNFTLDPTGAYLLAANQQSDTVVSFRVNSDSGLLEPLGHTASVPTPVCLKFA